MPICRESAHACSFLWNRSLALLNAKRPSAPERETHGAKLLACARRSRCAKHALACSLRGWARSSRICARLRRSWRYRVENTQKDSCLVESTSRVRRRAASSPCRKPAHRGYLAGLHRELRVLGGRVVGVSDHCAMWSNAPGAIWTSATDHCIGVSPVEGHSCQEYRDREFCEHDSAQLWPPLSLGEKKPRRLAGARCPWVIFTSGLQVLPLASHMIRGDH